MNLWRTSKRWAFRYANEIYWRELPWGASWLCSNSIWTRCPSCTPATPRTTPERAVSLSHYPLGHDLSSCSSWFHAGEVFDPLPLWVSSWKQLPLHWNSLPVHAATADGGCFKKPYGMEYSWKQMPFSLRVIALLVVTGTHNHQLPHIKTLVVYGLLGWRS